MSAEIPAALAVRVTNPMTNPAVMGKKQKIREPIPCVPVWEK
jgi:hypothetical protein